MKVLILDDDEYRQKLLFNYISKKYPKASVVQTRSANEAIAELEKNTFEVMFLDHDLDGKAYIRSEDPNTGYQVAKYISNNSIPFDLCVIHSMNYTGANRMENRLNNSGYVVRSPVMSMFPDAFGRIV